ncbi:MAG: hypothetical protein ACLQMF_05755 [Rectinemataceae bacterium]
MSDAALDVLMATLDNLSASIRWLRRSYDICVEIGIKEAYADDEFDAFENLTSRYSRAVDLIVNKTLRSIDAVEFLDTGSVIDTANRAEKRGIIDSVGRLRDLKDLRNEIAHEYETEDLRGLFGAVLSAVPQIFETVDRIATYCERYRASETP